MAVRSFLGRKAQAGPDAIFGVVLLAVLGLGGVFFVSIFVNSLALNGILNVLDSEVNLKCNYYLVPMMGSEYNREGDKLKNLPAADVAFSSLKGYYGESSDWEDQSYYFNQEMAATGRSMAIANAGSPSFGGVLARGYLGNYIASGNMLTADIGQFKNKAYEKCVLPVYGPYSTGQAYVIYSVGEGQ